MGNFQVRYDCRVINYNCRGFMRLGTGYSYSQRVGSLVGLVVTGDISWSRGRGFESQYRKLDGQFFTLICCKNCIACLKRLKINEKEAGILSIFLKKTMEVPTLLVLLFEAVINLFYRPLIISDRVLFYLTKRNDLFRHFSFYPWILEQWICKC